MKTPKPQPALERREAMPRNTTEEAYTVVADAIRFRRSLTANFENDIWHFSPHVLGIDLDCKQAVLGFRYVPNHSGRLPLMRDWCFCRLDDLRDIILNHHKWLAGPLESVPNKSFRKIDLKV